MLSEDNGNIEGDFFKEVEIMKYVLVLSMSVLSALRLHCPGPVNLYP